MSVEITSTEAGTATATATAAVKPPPPQLDIICYSGGVNISSGPRQYFFPYKTIQFLQLERRPETTGNSWILHIRTERDKINLTSARDLESDFRALMISYRSNC
jgi:hypothetical protein